MFEEMRLKAQQLSDEETIALLDAGEYGVLSTIGANGYPYGVPIIFMMTGRFTSIRRSRGINFGTLNMTAGYPFAWWQRPSCCRKT